MAERHDDIHDDICDVPGILVGHDTNLEAATGCTVVVCETPTRGGVDVRGGAPGTRETDLLDPRCMVEVVNAVLLTGGSAFGLNAAAGVVRVLEERGVGFDVGVARVPIVPAAVLFDLGFGRADIRPDAEVGARATLAAARGPVAQGTVGAGTGATLGKMGGPALAMKGGSRQRERDHAGWACRWRASRGERLRRCLRSRERRRWLRERAIPMAAGSHWVDMSSVVRLHFPAQTRRLPSSPPMRN